MQCLDREQILLVTQSLCPTPTYGEHPAGDCCGPGPAFYSLKAFPVRKTSEPRSKGGNWEKGAGEPALCNAGERSHLANQGCWMRLPLCLLFSCREAKGSRGGGSLTTAPALPTRPKARRRSPTMKSSTEAGVRRLSGSRAGGRPPRARPTSDAGCSRGRCSRGGREGIPCLKTG